MQTCEPRPIGEEIGSTNVSLHRVGMPVNNMPNSSNIAKGLMRGEHSFYVWRVKLNSRNDPVWESIVIRHFLKPLRFRDWVMGVVPGLDMD